MFRFSKTASLLLFSFVSFPQAAYAANFGFVRRPDYLDLPILGAWLMAGVSFVFAKTLLPKGKKDFVSVPKEERSVLLRVSVYLMAISVVIGLGMIFLGMGLQRALEW